MKIIIISIILAGLIGKSHLIGVQELKNVTVRKIDFSDIIEAKCTKNGGPTASSELNEGFRNMSKCFESLVDTHQLEKVIKNAKSIDDAQKFLKQFCRQSDGLRKCVRHFTKALEPCLDPPEKEFVQIILNIANSVLDFICVKETDRIASLISIDGMNCFNSKTEAIGQCMKSTYDKNFQNMIRNVTSVSEMTQPFFIVDHKACSDVTKVQDCMVKELKTCENPTLASVTEALIDSVLRATSCKELLGLSSSTPIKSSILLLLIVLTFLRIV